MTDSAGRDASFDVEADAREGHSKRMGHDLPVEERRERAVGRDTTCVGDSMCPTCSPPEGREATPGECPERDDGHDFGWDPDWNEEVCRACGAER